jgi:hypothetical protein
MGADWDTRPGHVLHEARAPLSCARNFGHPIARRHPRKPAWCQKPLAILHRKPAWRQRRGWFLAGKEFTTSIGVFLLRVKALRAIVARSLRPAKAWAAWARSMDGIVMMVNPRRGPALQRIADEIYRHYSIPMARGGGTAG